MPLPPDLEDRMRNAQGRELTRAKQTKKESAWPERHLVGPNGDPVPFHIAQNIAWDTQRRYVIFLGGTQSGKLPGGRGGYGARLRTTAPETT